MVYAVIYSLFLVCHMSTAVGIGLNSLLQGFGIAVGSDFYYLFDPAARRQHQQLNTVSSYTLQGSFSASNSTSPYDLTGTFTFTNNSLSAKPDAGLFQGNITCSRDPAWEWWRQGINPLILIALVPTFSLLLSMWNLQPLRSRQLPVMVFIACTGFATNMLANHYIFNHSDVVSFLGATVIGILGNLYSRLFKGTGFVVMVPGVLFLVPVRT